MVCELKASRGYIASLKNTDTGPRDGSAAKGLAVGGGQPEFASWSSHTGGRRESLCKAVLWPLCLLWLSTYHAPRAQSTQR